MTTETTTPATKIVIVSGQEFSVPADTDNEAIRAQLLAQGFADVASATIQTGKKTVGGAEYPTVEFVKKAGTKGMDGAELAALLGHIPATGLSSDRILHQRIIERLISGEMTIAEALDDRGRRVLDALEADSERDGDQSKGAQLCRSIDDLPAVAAPCAW